MSARVLSLLIAEPDLIGAVIEPGALAGDGQEILPAQIRQAVSMMPEEERERFVSGFRAIMAGMGADVTGRLPGERTDAAGMLAARGIDPGELGEDMTVSKSWHALHFLLAGTPWRPTLPPGNVVLGGREIGEDLGYGPLRYLTAGEVQVAATALEDLGDEEFRARFDPRALAAAELYPGGGWDEPAARDLLVETLRWVRRYFRRAADAGHGMLMWIG